MPPVVIATANVREGFLCQLIPWGADIPLGRPQHEPCRAIGRRSPTDDRRLQTTDRS